MAYHSILKAAQYNSTRFNLVRELYQLRQGTLNKINIGLFFLILFCSSDAPWQQMYNQQIKCKYYIYIIYMYFT